jgi:dipeptidase D
MAQTLLSLQPERLWFYFSEVLKIPRPSKKEEQIIRYLVKFGKEHKLETITDSVNNVIIRKPASPGLEKAPSVCLQGHVDMVCEKDADLEFDFEKDPIQAYVDDGWLKARGTTLGADNGIAVATMLALLEAKDIKHGPLECLFTVDEETGLTGAFGLDTNVLKSRILLNLDSEDDGEFFIGCAGGKDTVIELPAKTEPVPQGYKSFRMKVSGLQGGHSGDDIHRNRGNANKILNRFLWECARNYGIRVSSFEGGNLRNAIAREAFAIFLVPAENTDAVKSFAGLYLKELRFEFRVSEPDLKIELEEFAVPKFILDKTTQDHLLNSIYACPHGVMAWSQDVPNFVETSTNLASVKMQDGKIKIATSQRSSIESAKDDICNMVAATFSLTGASIEHSDGYPGWAPDPNSRILGLCVESYETLFGQKPVVRAIHAGLECGLIGDKYPGMDMISYGPTMKGVHSPSERLEISTVGKFWALTLDILQKIANQNRFKF